ncbi:hypothetical protein HDU67_001321 [Dinochytrium kinnereticum]|nr:hypothetical protein HDU67_001321 [Dinochytrium kinnereticum]
MTSSSGKRPTADHNSGLDAPVAVKRLKALIDVPAPLHHRAMQGSCKQKRQAARSQPKAQKLLLSFGTLRPHPFGVQPLGNMLLNFGSEGDIRTAGLGFLSFLEDEMIISQLLSDTSLLSHKDICRLSQCSKALYVLACFDDIWRSRTIAAFGGKFGEEFGDSWRDTFRRKACEAGYGSSRKIDATTIPPLVPLKVRGFYSDYLFSSWRCASIPLEKLCRVDAPDTIDRRSNLSVEEFIESYANPNIPVIITDVVHKWPAFGKWTLDYLAKTSGDVEFRAEAVDISLKSYASYSSKCARNGGSFEESPLYMFDRNFASRTGLAGDYTVPEYFSEDLFKVFGEDRRPDYRWLILGPPRSGSTFHLDPNQTSAWNAVLSGSKKWILFPPEVVPPGVFPSEDGSEVTSPVSLAEWFLNHYDEMKNSPVKPVECICRAGELIFVPRGWWHAVMNLEETIAITQNFVSRQNLSHVLRFMSTKFDQISGFKESCGDCWTLYDQFVEALGPDFSEAVEAEKSERQHQRVLASANRREMQKRKAEPLADVFAPAPSGFSFSFGFASGE